jgi:hypothetical protein
VRGPSSLTGDDKERTFKITHDLVVPKSQDPVTSLVHRRVAAFVINTVRMLTTVEFDHQLRITADEVREVPADGLLTHEFQAVQLSGAQRRPEDAFGVGGSAAKPP